MIETTAMMLQYASSYKHDNDQAEMRVWMKDFNKDVHKRYITLLAIAIWLILWQVASIVINSNILIASPIQVVTTLAKLIFEKSFWFSISSSFLKISLGFILAVVTGVLLSLGAYHNVFLKEFFTVAMRVIKSIPVASFVILALLWVRARNLSILISFLMVLPIIYTNVLKGVESADQGLLEMAAVFHMSGLRKLKFIYLPAVMPYFVSACSVGLGFCWKSGIAAEVIGLPNNSIGEQLYEAKLYLMTKEMFAWTVVIIGISVVFEKLILLLINKLNYALTKEMLER
ncbi:ABC transporter permease [Lachnoclostridium phytofermentans]|uniref:Binding-protein-dependent transport systems inner membrane component n=1 Tax=Lachnoclostridium phytofermentans (strain ATCC 700394 / DSM 18823 / ISDg) TaxID=357809 RepID=A9KL39_LACP7|nr:ABC transporter permease subunit [Lachnoclostridium phytofermentans]ABX44188.1 binding-protein-dependent transport systems inner membrane component [Lachnoclostridium phytofermentans ISDg]